jgi:hypothetical protein
MIKLSDLLISQLNNTLNEVLTYSELMKFSDPARIDRSKKMSVRKMPVTTTSTGRYWNFSYKSDPSHITRTAQYPSGRQHKGRILILNQNISKNKNIVDFPCSVSCTCEDYRYKYAYANNDKQSGELGKDSLTKNNGQFPKQTNPYLRPGLCKHLASLKKYLSTKINESAQTSLVDKLNEIARMYPSATMEIEE